MISMVLDRETAAYHLEGEGVEYCPHHARYALGMVKYWYVKTTMPTTLMPMMTVAKNSILKRRI